MYFLGSEINSQKRAARAPYRAPRRGGVFGHIHAAPAQGSPFVPSFQSTSCPLEERLPSGLTLPPGFWQAKELK